jgi:hypothetical protein
VLPLPLEYDSAGSIYPTILNETNPDPQYRPCFSVSQPLHLSNETSSRSLNTSPFQKRGEVRA